MKAHPQISPIYLLAVFLLAGGVHGQAFDVTLLEIKFNHDTGSTSSDGLTIQADEDTIEAPEYDISPSKNDEVAYKAGVNPTIKAKFTCTTPCSGYPSWYVDIRADASGGILGDVEEETVTFTYGSSGWYEFDIEGYVPQTVQKGSVTWDWEYEISSTWYALAETEHTVYVTRGVPQAPMAVPWVEVLEDACTWAQGKWAAADAAAEITEELNDSGFDYEDVKGEGQYYSNWVFYLGEFDEALAASQSDVNCLDMAMAVTTYGNAIGCGLGVSLYGLYGSYYMSGPVNFIDPIGGVSRTNAVFTGDTYGDDCRPRGFAWHAFAQLTSNKNVFDATLTYDTDSDPDNVTGYEYDPPNTECGTTVEGPYLDVHDWTAVHNIAEATYIDELLDDEAEWIDKYSTSPDSTDLTYNKSFTVAWERE